MGWLLFFFMLFGALGIAYKFRPKPPAPPPPPGDPKTFGDAKCFDYEECREQGLLSGEGIFLGLFGSDTQEGGLNFDPLHYNGERHLVTIAPTRTGKGISVQVPVLLDYGASLFMIDPKGENAAISARCRRDKMGHEVFILNPFRVLGDTLSTGHKI
jgi:type IV secretion system protein VirD4